MTKLCWLDSDLWFPHPENALDEPNGLLAVGGDLSPERLQLAYRHGIFPWFSDDQPILWWSPDPRCVLFPASLHISRSLHRKLKKRPFEVTFDKAFSQVIHLCGETRQETTGTWITPDMEAAYCILHQRGAAHSLECWHNGELVGGIYGIAMGRCFFGESMFSLMTDASKVVFVHLTKQLEAWGYAFIDCQVPNPHLFTLGAQSISREHFLTILRENWNQAPKPHVWELSWRYPG